MDKATLRRDLLARLRAQTAEARRTGSAAICDHFRRAASFPRARLLLAYHALPGEPDLSPLFGLHRGQRWAFPRVTAENGLVFHEMDGSANGIVGGLRIVEPDPGLHPEIPLDEVDLILVPGVGFDPSTRARLGRGKGHYDRFLARVLDAPSPPLLVGVAFSLQLRPLEAEEHDIPMDLLVTEEGWS